MSVKLIEKQHSDLKFEVSDFLRINNVNTYSFDTEKDNPRLKDPQLYTTLSGADKGIGYKNALLSRFHSHGEILEWLIVNSLEEAKDCIIFLDEPESGLSLTNQFRLIQLIKNAANNGCQFFIATHCYPLINEFNVISLEHNKQMTGKQFIKKINHAKYF